MKYDVKTIEAIGVPILNFEDAIKQPGIYSSVEEEFRDCFMNVTRSLTEDRMDCTIVVPHHDGTLVVSHNVKWEETCWPTHRWWLVQSVSINQRM